jgi:hypothetical protein
MGNMQMIETLFLDKKLLAEKEFEYDLFYNKGIELLQKYCGGIWTDYNLHDPGITILEQLCYALTELYYKSTFPVEDYFTENDHLPFGHLGLLKPQQVLPNGCTTINDLRRVLFDAVTEVGNIWIEHCKKDIAGLYIVYVDIADQFQVDEKLKQIVKSKIMNAFVKFRNLGEDIAEIIVLDRCLLDLHGEIVVRTARAAGEIYGEIYKVCSEYVSHNLHYRSVKDLQLTGMTLLELFDGPLLKNGIILENDLDEFSRMICIPEMVEKIKMIDGVVDVHALSLRKTDTIIEESVPAIEGVMVKSVRLPQNNNEIYLKLKCSDLELKTEHWNISYAVRKNLTDDPVYPDYLNDIQRLYPYTEGNQHIFDDYYSIQNDFPAIYGISAEGLPKNETNERKAKAKQLKAYLWLFEQVIADVGSSLQNIKNLFSVDPTLKQTYFCKHLNNSNIPGIEDLYTDPENVSADLEKALGMYDKYPKRRSEILDFMLGIYGLEFEQISLRNFRKKKDARSIAQTVIENKLCYLKNTSQLLIRLTKGINYLVPQQRPDTISGLELQMQLRIGNDPENIDPDEKMFFVEHILLRPSQSVIPEAELQFFNCIVTAVFPGFRGRYSNSQFKTFIMQIIEKSAPAHLLIDYIWCDEKQWEAIEPAYISWRQSFVNNQIHHDRASSLLTKLLIEYGKI